MLITFNPEDSKDFNVEGGGGLPKIPAGTYEADIKIINIEESQTQNGQFRLGVTYEVVKSNDGKLSTGTQFGDYINIQSTSPDASRIARQTVAKLGFAVTGDKDIMAKGQLNFDHTLYNVPFTARVVSKESEGGVDDKGKPIVYKNINIGKVSPIQQGNAQQPANNGYNAQPQGQAQQPAAWTVQR